ncbi:ABC transporter substrate-binding protein [Brevibacillus laterosporus]|uniref:ABC transporter substrate-binding protein n=1 Tax=Brevibacillus laterosporus TaxID=1465 RepID=UPI000EABA52E|nr:ABC transporter substrate-binding protein [Brevibacillus laterosporus]AYK08714.1 nickel ABC transporter substrate-binding protein [Brevibacillus laterosporus]
MKKKFGIVISMLAAISLVGCSSNNHDASKKDEKATVNIAISNESNAQKLDATSYDAYLALYGAVYEPLVEYGEKGAFKPGLAESWEISEDGKKYVFHLKKDVKFSDGSDVNAEAVKFTIDRAKAKNETSDLQTLTNLEKVEVIDGTTVAMHFTKISNQVLAELCQARPLRIMSPHSVEGEKIDGAFKEAIGTGAFTVKEISAEQVLMEPNPYYNHGNPVNYQVNFKTIEDGSSRTLALKSGEVDVVGGTLGSITDSDINSLKKDKSYNVHKFEGTRSHFLAFNPDNQVLTSTIRKGIELAVNKSTLSDKKLVGIFQENVKYVSTDNQENIPYDLNKARSMFESEGYVENAEGYYEKANNVLAFNLVIQTTEFPEWKEQAEIIESDLKKAGVKVNINIFDSESYYDVLWNTKKYDMIFYRTYTDALLPYNFLNSLYHNTAEGHGVLANDAKLTNLLDDFAVTIQEKKQQQIFDNIFKRISEETLAIPIDYKDEKFVTSSKISEFHYSGVSDVPIDFKKLVVK